MNELVAITSFVILALAVLIAAKLGKTALFVLSTTFIVISNITVQMPVRCFGVDLTWAIIVYSLVYFITDILCEYHGRSNGYRLAATNLAVQIVLWAYVWSSLQVTPVESGLNAYDTMNKLFGTTAQVTFAALVASAGPFLDIYVFSIIRTWWDSVAEKHRDNQSLWAFVFRYRVMSLIARNKLSTFAGQILNTVIFFSIALLNTGTPSKTIISIILSASIIKIAIAIADIPFLVAAERVLKLREA